MLTQEQRQQIIAEARSWIEARTPYVPHASIKGVGCDCATFLLSVYAGLGFVPQIELGAYSIQVHLHHEDTQYVDTILTYADEITEAEVQPGDMVLWKVARAFAHGGIVEQWPRVIHSMNKLGVIESDANLDGFLQRRQRRFFRLK